MHVYKISNIVDMLSSAEKATMSIQLHLSDVFSPYFANDSLREVFCVLYTRPYEK